MFKQPHTMEEALALRAELGSAMLPLGGGTDIAVALNRQALAPEHFLDLSHVEGYSDLRHEDGEWLLGGGARLCEVGSLPLRAIAEAAMSVGGPAIRNVATIAGNLGTASPAGDLCVALLAMDAEVELSQATRGSRFVPIDDYFVGFRKTALLADELITRVKFADDWRTAWYKIGKRSSINISLVCCAVGMSPEGAIRLAFGCVAPTVMRAKKAEALVEKSGLTDKAIEAAAASVMAEVSPIDDHRASAAYKRAMCGVLTRRLLRQLRDGSSADGGAS